MDMLEKTTIAKVTRRLIPFLMLCYFFCYLDRVNVGFAALEMNKDLGLSASVFGLGAGILFLTYGAFEVPSNIMTVRLGARRWIGRIMITWGIIAMATMFVAGGTSFITMRILLGAAEAGFFPAAVFFMSTWFPGTYRARIIGYFMCTSPIAAAIGAPVSTSLLGLDGIAGLHGWQWLFLIEGLPPLLLGIFTLFWLTEKPRQAAWLEPSERNWLVTRLATEERQRNDRVTSLTGWQTAINPRVIALGLVSFCNNSLQFGLGFFLPQIVKGFGLTNGQTGWLLVLPPGLGAIGMLLWSRHSDRKLERRKHIAAALLVAALGTVVASVSTDPAIKFLGIIVSQVGMFASFPIFIGVPSAFLTTGMSAAVGIALINTIGSLGAFFAPWMVGLINDATGHVEPALLILAGLVTLGAVINLLIGDHTALEREPDTMAAVSAAAN
jgi:MFS transporter, ACS family, tartrate transporter